MEYAENYRDQQQGIIGLKEAQDMAGDMGSNVNHDNSLDR